jgi:hypothetical protein
MAGDSMWRIRWGEHVLSENDITIGQAERIEDLTGESWLRLVPLRSAKHAAAITTVMAADATGRPQDEIAAEVRNLTIGEFIEAYSVGDEDLPTMHEDGNPPVAGTSTSSSRTSRKSRGAGRQP